MFMSEIGLKFSFLKLTLSGFNIKVVTAAILDNL